MSFQHHGLVWYLVALVPAEVDEHVAVAGLDEHAPPVLGAEPAALADLIRKTHGVDVDRAFPTITALNAVEDLRATFRAEQPRELWRQRLLLRQMLERLLNRQANRAEAHSVRLADHMAHDLAKSIIGKTQEGRRGLPGTPCKYSYELTIIRSSSRR